MSFKKEPGQDFIRIPKTITHIYGIIAVILVLIPEWIADFTFALVELENKEELPAKGEDWYTNPELSIASLKFFELREMARGLLIPDYSRMNKEKLYENVLKKLRSGKSNQK